VEKQFHAEDTNVKLFVTMEIVIHALRSKKSHVDAERRQSWCDVEKATKIESQNARNFVKFQQNVITRRFLINVTLANVQIANRFVTRFSHVTIHVRKFVMITLKLL
jgi:hypothetical protein